MNPDARNTAVPNAAAMPSAPLPSSPLPAGKINAKDLARWLIENFGRPMPEGLINVDLPVREIAELAGKSRGTIQGHLKELDHLGIRVRPHVFNPARLYPAPLESATLESATTPPPKVGSAPSRARSSSYAEALAALVDLVESAPGEVSSAIDIATRLLTEVAHSHNGNTIDPHPVRGPSRDVREDARPEDPVHSECAGSTTAQTAREIDASLDNSVPREPIDSSIDACTGPRSEDDHRAIDIVPATAPRTEHDMQLLLGPLIQLCDRYGLPAISNTRGLVERLAPFIDAQVRFAVKKLITETKSGALARPVGKLANVAKDRSPDYFPKNPPEVRLPGDGANATTATSPPGPWPSSKSAEREPSSKALDPMERFKDPAAVKSTLAELRQQLPR